MITPLRRRHRWLAPGMCFLALAGVVGAVAVRPARSSIASELMPSTESIDGANLLDHGSGRFRVAVGAATDAGRDVWLLPNEPLDIPDLLVYAVPDLTAAVDPAGDVVSALPEHAKLLGPGAQALPTHFRLVESDGALLLFSLAHQAVEAAISLSAPNADASQGGR